MKKIRGWFQDIFSVRDFNGVDVPAIQQAFNDPAVRTLWLGDILDELKRMNLEVDKRLLTGNDYRLTDLCARRQAIQDILESVLAARRQVTKETQAKPHNPPKVDVNLDRVTG